MALGVFGGYFFRSADGGEDAFDGVVGGAAFGEQVGGVGFPAGDGGQEDFGGDEFVAEFTGEFLGSVEHVEAVAVKVGVGQPGAFGLGIPLHECLGFLADGFGVHTGGAQHGRGYAVFLPENGGQQVGGPNVRVAVCGGLLQRGL